ncbi:hypothetical protein [Pseudoxanthomonas winnipegensis]|uniref:hypothetical protein n=1 Tax=Pseudoxanthomonas winnipegensis TaxID=2480810 RepID=UPI0030F3F71B
MKGLSGLFKAGHVLVIFMFVLCGVALLWLAAQELWHGLVQAPAGADMRARFNTVLECVGLLTIALVSIELGQTIFEEEVLRDVKVSGPTRVRRYLSRFLVVVVIALSIETLVSVFEMAHEAPSQLPYAASIGATAALLLVSWGVLVRFNRAAEELEPEAMADAKREDDKVES